MPDLNADPELLAGFLDEAGEALDSLDPLFVQLETATTDKATVEAIFRPIHSLKGNAAFFGFMSIKGLAHEMETLLDHIRKGRAQATHSAIDVLLAGIDALKAIIARLREHQPEIADEPAHAALVARVVAVANAAIGSGPAPAIDWNLALADAELLERQASDGPARQAAQRLRSLLGSLAGAVTPQVPKAHSPNDLLRELCARPTGGSLEPAVMETVEKALATLVAQGDQAASEIADAWSAMVPVLGWDVAVRDFIVERLPRLSTALSALEKHPAAPAIPAPAAVVAPAPIAVFAGKSEAAKTMRVAESTIDTFLHFVGELLVVSDLFEHLQRRSQALPSSGTFPRDFRRVNESFITLSNQLQRSIMSIRRVSIKPLLQKVPRLVRDVAQAKQKDIAVVIEGDHVEVDKSLIELLDAPLTHMTRNAADHGVEPPDQRAAAGKSRQGTITIRAHETDTSLVLSIADDGNGLNLAAIRRKGESLGLIQPGATLGEQDIINLIFASGVSTAEQVTDISGRGVGMDVVKRAVEAAGGAINVASVTGKGSTFSITLPKGVTTQIIIGYLAKVRGQTYVLPLDRVRETFKVYAHDLGSMGGRGHFLERHGEILPIRVLAENLGMEIQSWPSTGQPVVTVMAHRKKLGLAVDVVCGVQKVVIRQLKGLANGCEVFSGGALLGDGTVALVLDLDRLADLDSAA